MNIYKEYVEVNGRKYCNFFVEVQGVRVPIRPVHWSLNTLLESVAVLKK